MIIGINVVDLCYAKEKWFNEQSNSASYGKIMEYLFKNIGIYKNEICVLPEKGIERYANKCGEELGVFHVSSKCECDYKKFMNNDECRNCVCYDKHESHLGTCCVGKGFDAVLMIECDCDGFKEGVKHECLNNLGCEDIGGCWALCTGLKHQ